MKKFFKLFGIIALVAIIGLSMAACSNGDNNDPGDKPLFSVSGEFRGAGDGNALFKAATAKTVKKSARSARSGISADTSYELTGELEDGDILFRLKGTYDDATGNYTASAASSFARYTINGDANGDATATLAVKQGEEWISFIVSVTIKKVSVKGGDAQDNAGGLPSWAQGSWHDWWSEDHNDYTKSSFEAWSYFNQWYYEAWRSSVWHDNWDFTSIKYTVIEAEQLANGVYDVIFSYPVYKGTDAQKKTAFQNFFKEINIPAEFWNKPFNPWDHDAWIGGGDDAGKNWDNSIIWYICLNENHNDHLGTKIINWETFIKFFPTQEKQGEFWAANQGDTIWDRIDAVKAFLASKNIKSFYYWGWHEPGFDNDVPYEDRAYTCWEPTCEDGGEGGWWAKTHYYLKWGNQTAIQGDWDKYREKFEKWNSDDYLITYLRSQNVQPETWYTRVRIWMEGDTFMFYYYNGDNEAGTSNSHAAPACDTKSLSKIKGYTFDPNYLDWSYNWKTKRTSPR